MKPPERVPVQVGSYRTTLPVFRDKATSEKIVARIEACVRAVEDKSQQVDTVAFVLGAAYEFACEVHRLKEEQEEQDAELVRRLSETLGQIHFVLKKYTPAEGD
jgi:hypothetical protein